MRDRSLGDSYALYAEGAADAVDRRSYIGICNGYHRFLMEKVLEGHEVTLPERMGTLSVQGRLQRPRDADPEARAERRVIYHTNLHTDGFRYKYLWSKERVLVENKSLYSFRATRANKRAVSRLIKEGANFATRG